jgi:hypothetical protein
LKFGIAQANEQNDVGHSHEESQLNTNKHYEKQVHGMQPASSRFHSFDDYWDEDTVKQLDDSVSAIQNMRFMQSLRMQFEFAEECSIASKPLFFKHVFISIDVEKAVHQYVVYNIPGPYI